MGHIKERAPQASLVLKNQSDVAGPSHATFRCKSGQDDQQSSLSFMVPPGGVTAQRFDMPAPMDPADFQAVAKAHIQPDLNRSVDVLCSTQGHTLHQVACFTEQQAHTLLLEGHSFCAMSTTQQGAKKKSRSKDLTPWQALGLGSALLATVGLSWAGGRCAHALLYRQKQGDRFVPTYSGLGAFPQTQVEAKTDVLTLWQQSKSLDLIWRNQGNGSAPFGDNVQAWMAAVLRVDGRELQPKRMAHEVGRVMTALFRPMPEQIEFSVNLSQWQPLRLWLSARQLPLDVQVPECVGQNNTIDDQEYLVTLPKRYVPKSAYPGQMAAVQGVHVLGLGTQQPALKSTQADLVLIKALIGLVTFPYGVHFPLPEPWPLPKADGVRTLPLPQIFVDAAKFFRGFRQVYPDVFFLPQAKTYADHYLDGMALAMHLGAMVADGAHPYRLDIHRITMTQQMMDAEVPLVNQTHIHAVLDVCINVLQRSLAPVLPLNEA